MNSQFDLEIEIIENSQGDRNIPSIEREPTVGSPTEVMGKDGCGY